MKLISITCMTASLLLFFRCSSSSKEENTETVTPHDSEAINITNDTMSTNALKIYVDSKGVITADNEPTTLKELETKIGSLKTTNGTVYYSRDDQLQDPPKEAMDVMDIIAKYGLPIQFYTDKTFTKVVEFK